MDEPTLSIFLPNYNHAKFLPEALRSIEQQSYSPHEIIIIDDASTDNSVQIIEQFARKYTQVRFVRNEFNRGVIPIAIQALEEAEGSHLFGMSADDRIRPDFFEKSMRLLRKYPDAGFCSSLCYRINDKGQNQGLYPTPVVAKQAGYIAANSVLDGLRRHGNWFLANTAIWRRQALQESGGFRPELQFFFDGFMLQVLALRYGACFIPEPLCEFRQVEGQLSQASSEIATAVPVYEAAIEEMRTMYANLFPSDYISKFKKRALANTIEASISRKNNEHFEAMKSLLSGSTLGDKLMLSAIWLAMQCQFYVAKPYLATIRHGFWGALGRAIHRIVSLNFRK